MLRNIGIALLILFFGLQFTGGIGQLERLLPTAICWSLAPSYGKAEGACSHGDGVLLWLSPGQDNPAAGSPTPQIDASTFEPGSDKSANLRTGCTNIMGPVALDGEQARQIASLCNCYAEHGRQFLSESETRYFACVGHAWAWVHRDQFESERQLCKRHFGSDDAAVRGGSERTATFFEMAKKRCGVPFFLKDSNPFSE